MKTTISAKIPENLIAAIIAAVYLSFTMIVAYFTWFG